KRSAVISRSASRRSPSPRPSPRPAGRGGSDQRRGRRMESHPLPLAQCGLEGRGEGKLLKLTPALLLVAGCAHQAAAPGPPKTPLWSGESLRRAHRPKKAASVYAKWLDADPNDFDMRARYGQVLREAGALDESLEQARLLLGTAGENVSHTVIAYNALA